MRRVIMLLRRLYYRLFLKRLYEDVERAGWNLHKFIRSGYGRREFLLRCQNAWLRRCYMKRKAQAQAQFVDASTRLPTPQKKGSDKKPTKITAPPALLKKTIQSLVNSNKTNQEIVRLLDANNLTDGEFSMTAFRRLLRRLKIDVSKAPKRVAGRKYSRRALKK